MTSGTRPAARRQLWHVAGLVIGAFILGMALAALIFLPRTKINAAESVSAGLAVGQPAPDFTLNTLDGDQLGLSDFAGQPVLINFWASWCVPCRKEMPELIAAYEIREAEGFMLLGLNLTSIDAVPDVREFVGEFGVNFPILLDSDGVVAWNLYRIPGIPTSVFVNRDGTVARVQVGKMTGEQIERYVAEILQ